MPQPPIEFSIVKLCIDHGATLTKYEIGSLVVAAVDGAGVVCNRIAGTWSGIAHPMTPAARLLLDGLLVILKERA